MLLKMQSRPSHYAVPSTLQSLQRSSYTNGYSDYLNYGTYPPLTPNLYQTPAYTSNNTSSISSSTYLYYGGGQPTTNTLLEEPSSPNNSTASPGNSNPQSPACVFSPTGNNSKGLNDSSSPPLSYDASASDMLYTKYPVSYTSIPQYASSSTTPSFSTCTPYSIENNSTFSNSHSLSGNSGNSTGSFSVYSNGYGSSSSSSSNTAGGVYNHCMPPSSSTLYTEQHLSSGYSTPASVNIGSSGSSFALWNYPSLQVGKVSYDTPRFKLTPERAIPLIKWFEEHKDHPYPSRHEKMMLCQSTQLTFTQVSTWFANARRRMKKAAHEEEEDDNSASDEEKLK